MTVGPCACGRDSSARRCCPISYRYLKWRMLPSRVRYRKVPLTVQEISYVCQYNVMGALPSYARCVKYRYRRFGFRSEFRKHQPADGGLRAGKSETAVHQYVDVPAAFAARAPIFARPFIASGELQPPLQHYLL